MRGLLDRWAANRNLLPNALRCDVYAKCNESTGNQLRSGGTVCMSYIGSLYRQIDFSPTVRIVLVGKEHRPYDYDGGADFVERQRGITEQHQIEKNRFNQYYAGVVRTAAAVLGSATNCLSCITHCRLSDRTEKLRTRHGRATKSRQMRSGRRRDFKHD